VSKRKKRRPPKTYEQVMRDLAKRPVKDHPPSSDALSHRLPGSFESGKKR
jgi:hypothetical protein